MAGQDEFDAFYLRTRRDLLHQTYTVTADLDTAVAATRDAYVHAWRRWRRLRRGDSEAAVRREAWRLAALPRSSRHARGRHSRRRSAQPRRLDDRGSDTELLAVLAELPAAGRQLLVLQVLAGRDPTAAGADAAGRVQQRLGTDAATLQSRLVALHHVTDRVRAAAPTTLRRHGRRRRLRSTVLAAATTVSAVLGVAAVVLLVTNPAPMGQSETSAPPLPSRSGPQPPPTTPPRPRVEVDQLLDVTAIGRLDPGARWRIEQTSTRPDNAAAYAACNPARYADPRREAAYVRTFAAAGGDEQLAVEAVEVSRSTAVAEAAHLRLVGWYAGCQLPRLQLTDSFSMRRLGTDVVVLGLRRWATPVRTITVALTRTGVVTATLVHEVDRLRGAAASAFGRSVVDALARLCPTSGGECGGAPRLRPVAPPPTGEGPGFLGVVDLPPVARLRTPWVGTEPAPADPASTATLCDRIAFSAGSAEQARARTFVLPRADLPPRFGIDQTVGVLGSAAAADRFVDRAAARIGSCPDRQPSARVDSTTTVRAGGVRGRMWRLTYELAQREVRYRVGLVTGDRAVSQLVFSPTAGFDIGPGAFEQLLLRAGQRLAELTDRDLGGVSGAAR